MQKRPVLLTLYICTLLAANAAGQSQWFSSLVLNSRPSSLLSEYQSNPNAGSYTLSYNGSEAVTFYFEITVTSPQYGELIYTRTVRQQFPPGPYTQVYAPLAIVNWDDTRGLRYNNTMKETILRTGRFPEGDFTLEIKVKDVNGEDLNTASADFSIIVPDPPQLLQPQDADVVTSTYPMFQWTAVNAPPTVPVTYKITIVEKLQGQTAVQALGANPVLHTDSVINANIYNYPTSAYPLENGKEYVWQVTAADGYGTVFTTNNGNSEIWSFSFGRVVARDGLPFDTLSIVDGVAQLINLRRLTIQEDASSYTLSGQATLALTLEGEERQLTVDVSSLNLQKGFYNPPMLQGGSFSASLSPNALPTGAVGEYFKPTSIEYSMAEGLSIGGSLQLPGLASPVALNGRLTVNAAGITGTLDVERQAGSPLYTLGEGIARLLITRASVHFSAPVVRLSGELRLFGENSGCTVQDLQLSPEGTVTGIASCDISTAVQLVPGSNRLRLAFSSVAGDFSANLQAGTFDFNLQGTAGLELRANDTSSYGADVVVGLSAGGFSLISFTARGNITPPAIDLGWVRLAMSNLSLSQLSYTAGSWSFGMSMDVQVLFPAFNNLTLPTVQGASLGSGGLTLPAMNFSQLTLPPFTFEGFRFTMTRAALPPVTIPFFAGGAGATTGMNFGFDFTLQLPNLPGGGLTEQAFSITNASFNGGAFSATVPTTTFNGQGIDLTIIPGVQFMVRELSGSITANFSGAVPVINPNLRIRGGISLPPAFTNDEAGPGTGQLNLAATTLAMNGLGKISGRIEGVQAGYTLNISPLTIGFSNLAVDFSLSGDEQQIRFEGSITSRLPLPGAGTIEGSGTIAYELLTNRILSLNAQVSTPFALNIPASAPVFSFQLPRARITQDALILDGRSYLALGAGVNTGVTFRGLNLRLSDLTITSGDAVFDLPFAFKIVLENGNLRFRTVPANTQLTEDTGIMLNLPTNFSLGADGFAAEGSSRVTVRFQGRSLDSVLANYTDAFALSINPVGVRAGQVDFALGNRRVAYLNSSGFFPDMGYFAATLLPARIPLPVESIGYLQIKEGENFLVDYSSVPNGVRLQTREGQPVKLVLPVLRFSRGSNPELDIAFDVTLNTQNWQVTSGNLSVSIPEDQRANWDLSSFGIPFKIADIAYTALSDGYGFQLGGTIKAFGNELGDPVNLTIGATGRISGDIDLSLTRTIQLIPDSDKLTLALSRIAGNLDLQLSPLNLNFDLALTGGVRLRLDETSTYGANATFHLSQDGLSVEDLTVETPQEMPRLDFSWLNLGLSNFTLPRLSYTASSGWDFEVNLSVQLAFPSLNFRMPPINGLTIRPNGITIPAISLPEISDSFRNFYGFGIRPLAFRMQPFTFNWFTMEATDPGDWGFGFDFELSFAQMPNNVPEALRNTRVRILNAGFANGRITGNIQADDIEAPGIALPLGGSTSFFVRRIGGSLSDNGTEQNFTITIGGDIQMPEFMRCDGSSGVAPISTALTIDSRGRLFGRIANFIPPCPMNLGIGKLAITNSVLDFRFGTGDQQLIIELAGDLRLPAPQQGDSITASGNLVFDLLNGRWIDGEIAITTPFRWQVPNENPVLVFSIQNALLNYQGLRINGSSALQLGGGQTLSATFDNFLFDFRNLRAVSGSASFMGQFALKFAVDNGALNWAAVPLTAAVTEPTAVRLTMPSNLALRPEGLAASGATYILVRVGGREYANVRCQFSDDFVISYSPFRVHTGNARLYIGETLAGTIDRDGFSPGDILGMLPLPEKLPLPDTTIAYIVVKQNDQVLVETETVSNGLRIATRPGQRLRLVLPGLQFGAQAPPELLIAFSVTVNTSSFELVDGSITVSPGAGSSSLLSLAHLGIPLSITRLSYEREGGQPVLRAAAKLVLPASLNGAEVTMDSLVISPTGIAGNIRAGRYSETYTEGGGYLATLPIGGACVFKVGGVEGTFSSSAVAVRMSGDITADIFRNNSGEQTPVHWSAAWANGRFNFGFDVSHVPNAEIPLLLANFRPQAINGSPAFALEAGSSSFALTLSGVLTVPTLGEGFAVSFAGLRIASDGIRIPAVSISAPAAMQNFNLFGAQFALRDINAADRAISFSYNNRVLYLTMNGSLTFFGNTSTFRGLTVGSNGSISINQASLLSSPFFVVPNYVGIASMTIANSALRVDGFVKLPRPADTTRQSFTFSVNTRGEVTGGANLSLVNENPGIGGGDRTEWDFWIGKYDLTYAQLNLNFANYRQSTLQVMSDIYFMNDPNRYLRVGYRQGGTVFPGLTIRFDGSVQWGNLQMAPNLLNIDWEALKLNMTQANLANDGSGNFNLSLTGNVSVGVPGVTGGLNFNNLRISSTGGAENLAQSISGGVLSVANVVNLTVSNVAFSSTPTTIWVKGGQMPGGSSGGTVDSQRVVVNNYFRFGASISIANVASGGIEEFLVYKTNQVTNLTIRNANLSVPGVITFRADLVYTRTGNGFYLLLGGRGRIINQYEVTVIGKVTQLGGNTSFGVFVAASGLNITIPPAITLSSLGGGFFYNPDNNDLAVVRSMCGLDPGSMGRVNTTPGRFAVLVYAQAAIISSSVASGRVLLTITQNYFELYGQVILLNQRTYFNGSIYLHVGFTNSIAEGNINLTLDVSPLVRGNAQLAFYFYPNNIWGVDGRVNVRILNVLNCNADVFIGNPGFYIAMGASVRIDVVVFTIDAGMQITIWNVRNGSWGAYGSAWVRGQVFGITVVGASFSAGMINGSKSLIYGEATIETFFYDFRVWGAIQDGRTSGGRGSNDNYKRQIDQAITEARNMRNQRDAALAQINGQRGRN